MRTLSPEVAAQIRKLHNPEPYHELWRIQVDTNTSLTTWLPLVRHSETVDFKIDAGDDPVTFYPFDIKRGDITQDTDGNLPSTTVQLSNVTRESAKWVEMGAGVHGRPVHLCIVHSAHLDAPEHAIEIPFTCDSVSISETTVALELRAFPLFDVQVPQDRFGDRRCTFVYKDPETCAYNGTMESCSRLLLGDNGCVAHGLDEISRGLPPQHPSRFGAFPGASTGVRR